eukprot:CAMPEP_0178851688 /NCGR_PEP_ID=MMETSP0746-20121128/21264_1 /TAXON_ID=913974 /ORGANISM="Nitzschia punctata, Strain CCMP561" /LENGTH=99 /DNA_ID=CAMNT_0020517287 /DNA_START=746 /DNA_END=1046 /DNA_ORIENTATION=-
MGAAVGAGVVPGAAVGEGVVPGAAVGAAVGEGVVPGDAVGDGVDCRTQTDGAFFDFPVFSQVKIPHHSSQQPKYNYLAPCMCQLGQQWVLEFEGQQWEI